MTDKVAILKTIDEFFLILLCLIKKPRLLKSRFFYGPKLTTSPQKEQTLRPGAALLLIMDSFEEFVPWLQGTAKKLNLIASGEPEFGVTVNKVKEFFIDLRGFEKSNMIFRNLQVKIV